MTLSTLWSNVIPCCCHRHRSKVRNTKKLFPGLQTYLYLGLCYWLECASYTFRSCCEFGPRVFFSHAHCAAAFFRFRNLNYWGKLDCYTSPNTSCRVERILTQSLAVLSSSNCQPSWYSTFCSLSNKRNSSCLRKDNSNNCIMYVRAICFVTRGKLKPYDPYTIFRF